ncbi:MAG: Fic family protein [Alloprevotella sp.]|nr:Fic family protein [Alloprevotella sp.]
MTDFDEYIRQGEPLKCEKGLAWQTAIGLQAVDGLKPSEYLLQTARKDIEGEIGIDDVERLVASYYESKEVRTEQDEQSREADVAATNIRKLLAEKTFAFSLVGLTAIHRRIFTGIFDFAGEIREHNITKKEWVLRGDTVLYVSAPDISRAIEYDLEQERQFDYSQTDLNGFVSHFSKFVSGLWQIHPFREGNTRTTAVFAIMYLRSLGFDVQNDMFANHSWYFRNALVRANYQNVQKGIKREPAFLEQFFRNLLLGEHNELRNRLMLIKAPEAWDAGNTRQVPDKYPASTRQEPDKLLPGNANIVKVVRTMGLVEWRIKDLMVEMGLKDRENFMANYLTPAMSEAYLRPLYPDAVRHPRQRYLLTVKGMSLYKALQREE